MAGHQTRSKTRSGDRLAEATPKAASTSKRKQTSGSSSKTKPDSSGKGAKPAKKKGQDADAVPAKTLQEILAAEMPGASASKIAALARKLHIEKKDTAAKQRQDCTCIIILSGTH